ncbi:hypothetical protein HG531_006631 [Fusarium graminearum]|nr:hypothetical protein HG531_006631 [Fusarium graminearum]
MEVAELVCLDLVAHLLERSLHTLREVSKSQKSNMGNTNLLHNLSGSDNDVALARLETWQDSLAQSSLDLFNGDSSHTSQHFLVPVIGQTTYNALHKVLLGGTRHRRLLISKHDNNLADGTFK